jgi:hypothetical protein
VTGVELSLRSPVTGQLEPGEEGYCDTHPSVFQCYREEANNVQAKFLEIQNPSYMDRFRYLLQFYGPFSKVW